MTSLFIELKRRNVFRVAIAYVVLAWIVLQAGETLAPALHLPEWVNSLLVFFAILGFPFAIYFAWAFEAPIIRVRSYDNLRRWQCWKFRTSSNSTAI